MAVCEHCELVAEQRGREAAAYVDSGIAGSDHRPEQGRLAVSHRSIAVLVRQVSWEGPGEERTLW